MGSSFGRLGISWGHMILWGQKLAEPQRIMDHAVDQNLGTKKPKKTVNLSVSVFGDQKSHVVKRHGLFSKRHTLLDSFRRSG